MKTVRMGVFLIVLFLAATVMVSIVSADEKNISINITSPEEGDMFYNDVQPAFISVQGTIDAPHGIRNMSIANGLNDKGYGEVICGSNYGTHFNFSCEIFMTDHVTVIVTDKSGFVGSERRNFTNYPGPPPPGTIWVTGWVVDIEGRPVSNASIIFETMRENNPVTAITKTDMDGMYKTKKAFGFYQRVTVRKEGYQTFVREVIFKEYGNEFNITLIPEGTSVPGFNFESAVSAILVSLILVANRRIN
jgi:hypothetical protein